MNRDLWLMRDDKWSPKEESELKRSPLPTMLDFRTAARPIAAGSRVGPGSFTLPCPKRKPARRPAHVAPRRFTVFGVKLRELWSITCHPDTGHAVRNTEATPSRNQRLHSIVPLGKGFLRSCFRFQPQSTIVGFETATSLPAQTRRRGVTVSTVAGPPFPARRHGRPR